MVNLGTGFHPGQLSFLLRASSDTLPTAVNLRRWHIQCGAKCTLCDSNRPTTAHILGGCPIALSQQRYTYRHNQVLFTLISQLITLFSDCQMVSVYVDLQGHRFNDSPPETIPSNVLVTPYRPDVVIYNRHSASMGIIELTCPLDSIHHLESAHNRKLYKPEYVQLLAELDRLKIPHCYRTVEVSVLGHFQPSSIAAIKDVINFTQQVSLFSKGSARNLLFKMASASISASQRIFYGRNSKEWTINPDCF